MPRWRALPDELDPQVREFADQLRRLVDRSGLGIAALADRTGYSKTSWDRYLNGRLLAPKGAVVALAEVTGTSVVHLTTMWELAERAWSRSEMRHDLTVDALRIAQARAALGEFGPPPANDGSKAGAKAGTKGTEAARDGGSATVAAGIAGAAPAVPPQPMAPDADVPETAGSSGGGSWGLAGYRGPAPADGRRPGATALPSDDPGRTSQAPGTPSLYGEPPQGPRPAGPGGAATRRRRLTTVLAGVVGVLVLIGGVFFFTGGSDGHGAKKAGGAAKSPSPSLSTDRDLPAGVRCSGTDCTGKDAEGMGCSGDLATTATTATVGTTVLEVRYSRTCGAAWGRITQAAQGDEVQVTVGRHKETGTTTTAGDTIAYTPMIAVKDAAEAKACAILASGQKGCTK